MLDRLNLLRLQFGVDTRIVFYETLRDNVKQEVPLYEIIKRIEEKARLFKVFPVEVLRSIMGSMRGSQSHQDASLSAALKPWAPALETSLIAAGERMGHVGVALNEAADMMKVRQRIRRALVEKLSYPVALVLLLAVMLDLMGRFLTPLLEEIVGRDKWPAFSQLLGFMADNSAAITAVSVGALASFAIAFSTSASRWTGPVRDFFDRYVPPWTIYREMQAAMSLMTISMLTASGLPMTSAVELLRANSTPWVADHMARVMRRMRSGKSESIALVGTGGLGSMFDAYTSFEISLYSAASSTMATKLKDLSIASTARAEKSMSKALGLAKWLVMTLVAGLLCLAVLTFLLVTSNASSVGGLQ
jgi:type II secretory pathway component PulF